MRKTEEKSLIIMKPDCIQRGLLGEIIQRFERKGFKIIGLKMAVLNDALLDRHYEEHLGKSFLPRLKDFMKSAPVVLMAVSGLTAVSTARFIVGATRGGEADAGTIRGDFSMGMQNVVHASSSVDAGEREVSIFFSEGELFDYNRPEYEYIYGEDERGE